MRPNKKNDDGMLLIGIYTKNRSWLIMGFGLLAKKQPQEGAEESLSAISSVVNELEEAEVEGKTLLRDAAVRPQPGAQ